MADYFETARQKRDAEKYLTTGCAKLDSLLGGGIACRGITQFYGPAGTGKTQLALQLCLTVQAPENEGGFATGAVYICTESVFPSRRFQELIQKLNLARKHRLNGDLVFIEHVATIEDLETCLIKRIPILRNLHKIGLIVVDSIAAPYRVEEWNDALCNRGGSLRTVGRELHKLSNNGRMCIICINQVTANLNYNLCSDTTEELPALGTTWSSMITASIRFYKSSLQRYVCIKLSQKLPETTILFEILGSGIRALNDT